MGQACDYSNATGFSHTTLMQGWTVYRNSLEPLSYAYLKWLISSPQQIVDDSSLVLEDGIHLVFQRSVTYLINANTYFANCGERIRNTISPGCISPLFFLLSEMNLYL